MATTHYSCEHCGCRDVTDRFLLSDGTHSCPTCAGSDVFPYRVFECHGCGKQAEQLDFFGPNLPANGDPIEEKWDYKCDCGSTRYKQIAVRNSIHGDLKRHQGIVETRVQEAKRRGPFRS